VRLNPTFNDDQTTQSRMELAFNTHVVRGNPIVMNCRNDQARNWTAIIQNSIFTGSTGDAIVGGECVVTNSILFPQNVEIGTNLTVDPLLVDPAAGDLRPRPESPARDQGIPSITLPSAHDIEGTPRPQGAGHDIGAFELAP
jgi:hypothetical protein